MQRDLSLEFLRVVEKAAIAAAHTMGYGDRHAADDAAVKAMRAELSGVAIRGRIVIGEGERDEAPMLYIGEEVGNGAAGAPGIDIAVDPLEGRSEEHTSELQSQSNLVCRLLLEKKKKKKQ